MQLNQFSSKINPHRRWQRYWPAPLVAFIGIIEILFTGAIFALEFWSMILNMKYSFFFIGFMASVIFLINWISTITVACCRRSLVCAIYTLVVHIFTIAASSILLYYDARFLQDPNICLWPNNLCNEGLVDMHFLGLALNTSNEIHWMKFTLIKIQIACAAIMIATCIAYIMIFIYIGTRVYAKNTVVDPHTTLELGRIQAPPPPHWSESPRESLPSSDF